MSTVNSAIKCGRTYEGGSYMTSHIKQDRLSRFIYNSLILITDVSRNVSHCKCQSYNVLYALDNSFHKLPPSITDVPRNMSRYGSGSDICLTSTG